MKKNYCTLTNSLIKNITCTDVRHVDYYDTVTSGLCLRVHSTGYKEFLFFYKDGKNVEQVIIGNSADVSLEHARQDAQKVGAKIILGLPPTQDIPKFIPYVSNNLDTEKPVDLLSECMQEFLLNKDHLSSIKRYTRRMNNMPKSWHDMPVCNITARHIRPIMNDISAKSGPSAGTDFLAVMKSFFGWLEEHDYIQHNPIKKMRPTHKSHPKERFLTDTEIKSVWQYADKIGYLFGHYLKIAVLTGQRRNEISHMRWSEIDWDTKIWTIPATKTKNAKIHKVPLSRLCIQILKSCPQDYDWVFTTTGKTPISGFSKYMQNYRRDTGLVGWRLHDIRRTLATNLAAKHQINSTVISVILNHSVSKIQGVTHIYIKHDYLPESREGLETYAKWIHNQVVCTHKNRN